MSVTVFSERLDVALELLTPGRGLARQLGTEVTALAVGRDPRAQARELVVHGADRVFVVAEQSPAPELCLAALEQLMGREPPEIVLLGATSDGVEIASRLAQRTKVGCASECLDLTIRDGRLVAERRCLGRFVARELIRSRPAIATVQPRRFDRGERLAAHEGVVEVLPVEPPEPLLRVVATSGREESSVRIEAAETVVAAGRGLRNEADLAIVRALAEALGGAVAGTRPLTDDLGWLPADVKIGLSGHSVKPGLYIACGISGQIEHVVGMWDAGVVVAIDSDPEAPIMQQADFRVVGDLYEIVPALTRAIREMRS